MGVRVIFKIVNFLMLALSLLNQANAQTVSAEKTEVFAGERIEVIWTHPSTDGFNKPSWSLCVKSVPTHLASTGALPTLDSYCIEDDYRYTVSGRGVYSFSKYLLPSMDVGHFVVAVVDKRENYRVYDHVNITVNHPVVQYRADIISLAENRVFGAGELLPFIITPPAVYPREVGMVNNNTDEIAVYKLPVRLPGGAIDPGRYIQTIRIDRISENFVMEQERSSLLVPVRHGAYELHYIHHLPDFFGSSNDWVIDRQKFEIGIPDDLDALRDVELFEGQITARLDRTDSSRVSSNTQGMWQAQVVLYEVGVNTKTQVAVEYVEVYPRESYLAGYSDEDCEGYVEACYVEVAFHYPQIMAGRYQVQFIHKGIIYGSEQIEISQDEFNVFSEDIYTPSNFQSSAIARVGKATPQGSIVKLEAFVPKHEWSEGGKWMAVVGKGSGFTVDPVIDEPVTSWKLRADTLLEQELLLPAGEYHINIYRILEANEEREQTEYSTRATFDFFVDIALEAGLISALLDAGETYAPGSMLNATLEIDDGIAVTLDPSKFRYVVENTELTSPVCYRSSIFEYLGGEFEGNDIQIQLPSKTGKYALRIYYPTDADGYWGLYRLAGEEVFEISAPRINAALVTPTTIPTDVEPQVTLALDSSIAGVDPQYLSVEFPRAGYTTKDGGIHYPVTYLGRKSAGTTENFIGDISGLPSDYAGAFNARVRYKDLILVTMPFDIVNMTDPEAPDLSVASRGVMPDQQNQAVPYVARPQPKLATVCNFVSPEVIEPVEDEVAKYQPPPFLGLEAAVYPREPIPGMPMSLGFRIENTSQHAAAGVYVDLSFANPRTEMPPKDIEAKYDYCQALDEGSYRCDIGDMQPGEVGDVYFHAQAPMTGNVIWTADLHSSGDLGGAVELGGVLGERAPPRIMDVVVLADQQHVESEIPLYPYPFGPNSRGKQSRYLLLVAHNLPQRPIENMALLDTGTVNYAFMAFPDAKSVFYQDLFTTGWKGFYDIEDGDVARTRAEIDGYDAVLVRADLLKGILPGQQTVSIFGTEGHWGLEFGDISARLSFIRLLEGGGYDFLINAYVPERIALALETNMVLPVDEIPVYIDASLLGSDQDTEIILTARRSDRGGGRLYFTDPLDLHQPGKQPSLAGGTALPAVFSLDSPPVLQARVDVDFMFEKFRLPVEPVIATTVVKNSPTVGDYSWLWKDALNRAATCNSDIIVDDWAVLTQAESNELWNWIILTTSHHFPGQSVTFGHHAAAILLRDKFLEMTGKQIHKLEWIKDNQQAVKGFLGYMKLRATDEGFPVLAMEVDAFTGGGIEFRYAIMNSTDWLAEQENASEEAIEAWQLRATTTAIGELIKAANGAVEEAVEAGDCDVEALVRLTGFSFDNVIGLLKPDLMTLAETSNGGVQNHLWVPDTNARFWLDQLAPLAEAVLQQKRRSNTDTDLALLGMAVLTMPLALTEAPILAIIGWGVELADFGVTVVHELTQKFDSDTELKFSLGATLVIGDERFKEQELRAKGWASTTFGIGTSAIGAITGGFEALPEIVKLARVARGRHVTRVTSEAVELASLKPIDLEEFGAFAMGAQMRREISGVESLSVIERKAVDLVEEFGSLNSGIRLKPELDVPPVSTVDSFAPSSSVRFDPDPDTGFAVPRAPAEGRISTPRNSGEVPNALAARVPENGHVKFMTANEFEELPLGERLGGGHTSEVFAHPEDPDNLAIRVTYLRDDSPASALDEFGDRALRTRVTSEHVRPVRVERSYDVILSDLGEREVSRVLVVERLPETAQTAIARQGGRMSVAQMMAYEGAMRDLNKQGLVWLDNKWDNFSFTPLNDGSGRVQIVVLDPGGIAPIRAGVGASSGLSVADVARSIQLKINGEFATQLPGFERIKTPKFRAALRRDAVFESFDDAFDYEALGIAGREQLLFNPKSGDDFDYLAPLFEVVE